MLDVILNRFGDAETLFALGLAVGLLFGAAAQHSRFCLRAATAELGSGRAGPKLGIWLIVFATALLLTQGAVITGLLDPSQTRQISGVGSLSGAIIGGLMFGAGMILARGCASRLLVLSGTGNMRALITGLVLTVVAQASYRGVLAPAREAIFGMWTVSGGAARDLVAVTGLGRPAFFALGVGMLIAGLVAARRGNLETSRIISAALVGVAVTIGWVGTFAIAQMSFEPVAVSSVTFTGPATDTLMGLINERALTLSFSVGLVPGVFLGSGLMAVVTKEFHLQRFDADTGMERYLMGAVLMGFGAMLAGGCAVGAGVSGGAVLALTAWVAVASMWVGALVTGWIMATPAFTRAAPTSHAQ
ncbi:YeeE/YedE family protein [Meridianimarinicoccus aquatilis]|uniref:YeeE/YedE family protein n=1 Tax=Meridianimarinicoccus aquatilis TaxID=2552766 RepID=A0A4R6B0S8_9RHOB|nr:YeeE/YedE family protein [Fluviibacterium aquatile]TDL90731.1 YeeE/YedE family protein [Fluviibacterium aquatile]